MGVMRHCEHDECNEPAVRIVEVQPYLFVARCEEHPVEGEVVFDEVEAAAAAQAQTAAEAQAEAEAVALAEAPVEEQP